MRELKNLMLWAGQGEPSANHVLPFYAFTRYGDTEAFYRYHAEIEAAAPDLSAEQVTVAAHESLSLEQQYQGQPQEHANVELTQPTHSVEIGLAPTADNNGDHKANPNRKYG